jgi:hypothetical protein
MRHIIKLLVLCVLTVCYVIGFKNDPFLFFPLVLLMVYFVVLYVVFLYAARGTLRLIAPGRYTQEKLKTTVLLCAVFLFFGAWAINRFILPHKTHPLSIVGNAGIVCFTLFLGLLLLNIQTMKKVLGISIIAFAVFILCLGMISAQGYHYVEPSTFEQLASLPYLALVPATEPEKTGVTIYDPEASYQGLNMYTCPFDTTAYVMDMSGTVVHAWSMENDQWHHAAVMTDGSVVGVVEDKTLVKLDWNSRPLWSRTMRFHHDIAIAENKDIYSLLRKDRMLFHRFLPLVLLDEYVVMMTAGGAVKQRISLFEAMKDQVSLRVAKDVLLWALRPDVLIDMLQHRLQQRHVLYGWIECPADILHANSVEVMPRDIEGFCRKGDLLVCMRNLDLIGIVDVEKKALIWQWGPGDLRMPHHPTLLKNGNILVFDNGWERKYSRVIELNPLTGKIVWEYKAEPPEGFFSLKRGASQRLPNGNTLITESDRGRVFEVTRDGRIVWEFYAPVIKEKNKRKAIYRMKRLTDTIPVPLQ